MNQITLLFRNLIKYRRYAIPNIVGLAIAIAALITIFQFVSFELSYDRFYEKNLSRVIVTKFQNGEKVQSSTVTYSAVGPALVADYPEIINQTRVFPFGNSIVNSNNESIVNIRKCVAVEPSFFEMFDMEFLSGSANELFDEPGQIIMTRSTANNIFGPETSYHDLINQTVKLDNDPNLYSIAGIVENMHVNSHLNYNLFMSYSTIISTWGISQARYDWNMIDFRHYVQLMEGVNPYILNQDLATYGESYLSVTESDYERFQLEKVEDIYLSDYSLAYDIAKHGDRQTILILLTLGCVLFIVSWINFLNLNSSMALEKSKFIGIRKILGIQQKNLRWLLMQDVIAVYVVSVGAGVALSFVFSSWLQGLDFEIRDAYQLFTEGYIHTPLLLALIGLLVFAIVFATIAYYRLASRVKPIQALRARRGDQVKGSAIISKVLLGLQFALSMIAFSTGLVVYDQQEHIHAAPMGFNMDNLWVLQQPKLTSSDSTFKIKLQTFKSGLLADPRISKVTTNQRTPGQQLQVDYSAKVGTDEKALSYLIVDQDYLNTYSIELLSGKGFEPSDIRSNLSNVRNVLINKATLVLLEASPSEALGRRIELFGAQRTIIGVVDNYRQESMMNDFQPTVLLPLVNSNNQIVIKAEGSPNVWLSEVEDQYARVFPGNSFEYRHLRSEYEGQYASVYSASRSLGLFTLFTVMISLFGMIALATLNLLSRVKEIGIKKILGASESTLYGKILKTYLIKFFIASLLVIPLVFLISANWLEQFSSSIELGAYHFIGPMSIMAVVISSVLLITSRKIVRSNPVDVLRAE